MKETRFYWNGERTVPSGTSVLPSPYLAQWAANCAVDYLQGDYDLSLYENGDMAIFREDWDVARKAYKQESREAADYGTYIHKLCELTLMDGVEVESPHELTQGFMEQFRKWVKKHNVKPIAMEHEILMPWYGGRLDLVCEMDSFWMTKAWCKKFGVEWYKGIEKQRVITLVDFKTGKGAYYESWKYQLAGYRQGYNERDDVNDCKQGVSNEDDCLNCCKCDEVQHHGILKFNKETGKVNYKDFTVWDATRTVAECPRLDDGTLRKEKYIRDYETDRATFNGLVAQWWLENRGVVI
jgi:hypothetical protein